MSKHTPGKWRPDSYIAPNGSLRTDRIIDEAGDILFVLNPNTPEPIRRANAELAATAPDLLAALEEIATALEDARANYGCTSEYCSGTCHFCANIRRARAAIQKARVEG
jgi:hypothetical protein